jgi:ketosteroid isomerase-like protein
MMTAEEETRRVVEGYFAAWTSNKVDEAYALLADDLAFWGPTASYQSAAAFRPALTAFAAMTKRAQATELVVAGNRAALLYDCELPRRSARSRSRRFSGSRTENPLVRNVVRRH